MIGNPQLLRNNGLPVNQWPVNQAAQRWLRQANQPPDPHSPYLVQLLNLGFQSSLFLPGQGQQYRAELSQAASELYDPSLDPVKVMRWFQSNPQGPSWAEQSQTLLSLLEQARSWEEAAQSLMEWFYDLKAGQDPYYRPAASHQG